MDTILGKLDLTIEQLQRSSILKSSNIKGFSLKGGVVTVVHINDFTEQEMESLKAALLALDDSPLPKSRLEEIKEKLNPTLPEVIEALKFQGIL